MRYAKLIGRQLYNLHRTHVPEDGCVFLVTVATPITNSFWHICPAACGSGERAVWSAMPPGYFEAVEPVR